MTEPRDTQAEIVPANLPPDCVALADAIRAKIDKALAGRDREAVVARVRASMEVER
jgi:hypothetical protein